VQIPSTHNKTSADSQHTQQD